jgi:hypothetical protein
MFGVALVVVLLQSAPVTPEPEPEVEVEPAPVEPPLAPVEPVPDVVAPLTPPTQVPALRFAPAFLPLRVLLVVADASRACDPALEADVPDEDPVTPPLVCP